MNDDKYKYEETTYHLSMARSKLNEDISKLLNEFIKKNAVDIHSIDVKYIGYKHVLPNVIVTF